MTCVDRRLVKILNIEISDIRPGVVLFHVDQRTDGQARATKQPLFSVVFANTPKTIPNRKLGYTQLLVFC